MLLNILIGVSIMSTSACGAAVAATPARLWQGAERILFACKISDLGLAAQARLCRDLAARMASRIGLPVVAVEQAGRKDPFSDLRLSLAGEVELVGESRQLRLSLELRRAAGMDAAARSANAIATLAEDGTIASSETVVSDLMTELLGDQGPGRSRLPPLRSE